MSRYKVANIPKGKLIGKNVCFTIGLPLKGVTALGQSHDISKIINL